MAGKVSPPLLKVWTPTQLLQSCLCGADLGRLGVTISQSELEDIGDSFGRGACTTAAQTVLRTTVSGDGNGSTVVHLPSVVSALVLDSTDPSFRFAQADSIDKV